MTCIICTQCHLFTYQVSWTSFKCFKVITGSRLLVDGRKGTKRQRTRRTKSKNYSHWAQCRRFPHGRSHIRQHRSFWCLYPTWKVPAFKLSQFYYFTHVLTKLLVLVQHLYNYMDNNFLKKVENTMYLTITHIPNTLLFSYVNPPDADASDFRRDVKEGGLHVVDGVRCWAARSLPDGAQNGAASARTPIPKTVKKGISYQLQFSKSVFSQYIISISNIKRTK